MKTIEIYGSKSCVWCERAKALLAEKNYPYDFVDVSADAAEKAEMIARMSTARGSVVRDATVPQIFVGSRHIGGFSELAHAERSGFLQQMIAGE